VLHAFIVFAAETLEETEEHSHAAFYVAGGVLALWAVLVSFVGIRRHENWPSGEGTARAIMGISALLVVAAMATAVITA
jgi:nitric oxide reductase large subunit